MAVVLRLVLIGVLTVTSCAKKDGSKERQDDPVATSQKTSQKTASKPTGDPSRDIWYRSEVELASAEGVGPIPFFMRIPSIGDSRALVIRVGGVDTPVDSSWQGDQLSIDLPLLRASLRAQKADDGTLSGTWSSDSWAGGKAALTFRAAPTDKPDPAVLFPLNPEHMKRAMRNLTGIGVWNVTMADESQAKLTVEKASERGLIASFQTSGGNNVALGGMLMGNQLYLASFDGSYAFLLRAQVDRTKMQGSWTPLRETTYAETFTAVRTNEFALPQTIQMLGRDLEIPGVDFSAYANKPLFVEIVGSWCANCRSAQPFMVEMYQKYHPMGLEMVTVTYEFSDDEAQNRALAQALAKKYGLTWKVIPVSGTLEQASEIMPQTVDGIDLSGLPIAVFIRRDGFVHQIASGFPSPGMSSYDEHVRIYEAWIREIIHANQ